MRECIGHAPAFVATRVGEVPCPEEAGGLRRAPVEVRLVSTQK